MNNQSRVLTSRSQGSDVSLLQGRLLELGAAITPDELASALFGLSTRQALLEFQGSTTSPRPGSETK